MIWISKWKRVCCFCPEQYIRIVKQKDNFYTVMITFRREKYWRIELLATGKQKTDDSLYDYYPIDISSYGYEMLLEHQYAKCQRIAERITRNFFRKNPDYEPICLSESEYERKIIDEMKEYAHQMMS